ncbi:SsgA family sporulation/cell division regulator [Kitasatospora sp. NPDC004240]
MSAVHAMPVTFPHSPLPDVPVPAELRFEAALPYAAHLAFPLSTCDCTAGDDLSVCWTFGRELLNEGRHTHTGTGDVTVCPGPPGEIRITLQSATGNVTVAAPTDLITAFLADTYTLVPAGEESDHLDIDAALGHLLDNI